ncbi:MAG: FG-GAP-like repeat-containing protein [Candidatus Kerfeldbacteria bacterium]
MKQAIKSRFVPVLALVSMLAYLVMPLGAIPRAAAQEVDEQDTLITDFSNGRVVQVDSTGRVVWVINGLNEPWRATRLLNTHTLITERAGNRVVEMDLDGNVVWQYTEGLNYPQDAERLDNGNTLITDMVNMRVIEVNLSGDIVWEMIGLSWPNDASRLANGNTLIADSVHRRVIEVDPSLTVVWEKTGFSYPEFVQRLDNGNTLITDDGSANQLIEVDSIGSVVWSMYVYHPDSAVRLPNGHTLVAVGDGNAVWEVDNAGTIIWQKDGLNYPTYAERVSPIAYVNRPPVANAGGPYVTDENTAVTLDASASTDPFGESLQYRWDMNNDGTWDTDWSDSPQLTYAWPDDYNGLVKIEVSDGDLSNIVSASVTVTNVNPNSSILTGVSSAGNYIAVSDQNGELSYMGIADGTIQGPHYIGHQNSGTFGAGIGDFDNDGVLEVLAGDAGDTWYYDKLSGEHNFAKPVSIDHRLIISRMDFAEADFNNDGNLDAVMSQSSKGIPQFIVTYIGHGDGTFAMSIWDAPILLTGLDSADFNRDGQIDLVAVGPGGRAYVYLGNGDGTFQVPTSLGIFIQSMSGVSAGDFNNDGCADIVVGQSMISFFPGNGDGTFGKPIIMKISAKSLAETDINNDGNLDLVYTDGTLRMYYATGNGDGTFTPQISIIFGKYSALFGIATSPGSPARIDGVEDQVTNFQATFTDQGYTDTHTATWDWGDGSPVENGIVTETNNPPAAQGTVTGSHQYDNPSEYTVTLTVSDDDGGITTDTAQVVIAPNTQPGTDVPVNPTPGVDITFSGVTQGGSTTATVSDHNPGPGQAGFRFLGTYYDISTTATYTPPVTICLDYDDTGMSAGRENALKIMHWDGATWTNVTSSLDTVNNSICGTVSSFSWFAIAYDETPPVTSLEFTGTQGSNDWYVSDVTVTLTAADNEAGTGVAGTFYSLDGTTWNPYTEPVVLNADGEYAFSYYSIDVADNAEVVQTATVKRDTVGPEIVIAHPGQDAVYFLNYGIAADWSVSDDLSGLQSASGTTASGAPIDTATVGDKTYTVTATDNAGNNSVEQITYDVQYLTSGTLQPINPDGTSIFRLNRTIPVKFRAWDALGQAVPTVTARLYVTKLSDVVFGHVLEPEVLVDGDNGVLFRYDSTDQQYIYNLSTKGMTVGTYQLRIALDDGTSIYALVSLR